MRCVTSLLAAIPLLLLSSPGRGPLPDIPANSWTRIRQDQQGARRHSSFRYVADGRYFLLWGYMEFDSSDYGNPDQPWPGNNEYDVVAFDLGTARWESQYPREKENEWRNHPPPMHLASNYQGITIGSRRPQLKEREGVLRPDLNIVFDQVTYDPRRARMIYFTGGRTFAYDVKARRWSDAAPAGGAPPVLGGSLAYDPVNDEIVLSGGGHVVEQGPGGTPAGFTGTWLYQCATSRWRRLNEDVSPPPRLCTRLVCDTKNLVMVVFGGDAYTHYLADTWLYDLKTRRWRASKASGGPPARAGHFTVYDPGTGWVIVGGGYNRQDLTDMWAYDAAADRWMKLKGEVPTGWHIAADIMPEESLILLTTSAKAAGDRKTCNEIYPVRTTYALRVNRDGAVDAGVKPQPQGPMPKRSKAEALAGTQPDARRRKAQLERIRNLPVNQWVLLENPGRAAPLRTWGSCAFDTDKNRIVYWGGGHCGYGGDDYDFYDIEEHTWTPSPVAAGYPERNWDKSGGVYPAGLMLSGAPFMRHGRKCYAYDPVSRRIVNMRYIHLTAGYEPDALKNYWPFQPDFGRGEDFKMSSYSKWVTWTYQPESEKWEILCPTVPGLDLLVTTPGGVVGVDYFWDGGNTRGEYQGKPINRNSVYRLDVAGRRWTEIARSGPYPENLYEQTALVYDSRRQQLILHGGGPDRDELWKFPLSGGRWERIAPGLAPDMGGKPPSCWREAVYLPEQDVVLTASLPSGGGAGPGIYAYHVGENRWQRVNIPPPPGKTPNDLVGWNRAWAYDPRHDLVLMVLGDRPGDQGRAQVFALRFDRLRASR